MVAVTKKILCIMYEFFHERSAPSISPLPMRLRSFQNGTKIFFPGLVWEHLAFFSTTKKNVPQKNPSLYSIPFGKHFGFPMLSWLPLNVSYTLQNCISLNCLLIHGFSCCCCCCCCYCSVWSRVWHDSAWIAINKQTYNVFKWRWNS